MNGDEDQKQNQSTEERDAMISAHKSALQIIAAHVHIAGKGLMTYYGVHVIHQLTQAGRTLVAILLNCKSEVMQPLISPGLDALRSCVALLRRFSGRYVCGLRSGDLLEEFCRLTQIPLEPSRQDNTQNDQRPAWIRPVRKKTTSTVTRGSQGGDSPSQHDNSSPEAFSPSDFFAEPPKPSSFQTGPSPSNGMASSVSPTNTHFGSNGADQPASAQSFLDSSGGGLDLNSQLYLSHVEMMAMFGDGSVDVSQMFTPEFVRSQQAATPVIDMGHVNGGGANPGFAKLSVGSP